MEKDLTMETVTPMEEDFSMETLFPMEEDLTIDHFHHAFSHLIVSRNRWECKQCENFPLCDKYCLTVKNFEYGERNSINQKDKHTLDESEIKDYDVCNSCYQKDGASFAECDAQYKEDKEQQDLQLKKMFELLLHASQCRVLHCPYPHCHKVKGLFLHGVPCKIRVSRGCVLCTKMSYLLQLHAHSCKVSECHVPRCRDLKGHMERLQQWETYSQLRAAAAVEKMWQRATKVAGGSH